MIKRTFYNLPTEKREKIIDVTRREFRKGNKQKITINSVIKNAGISRGSFYQYFDDKLDLVEVLIRSFIDKSIDDVRRAIVSSDGDIFYTFECMYDVIIRFSEDEKQKRVLKNLISNVRANNNLVSDYIIKRYKGIDSLINITDEFSRKGFRFKSDEDMILLQQILTSVLKNAIYNYYVFDADAEETKKRYLRKLYIIKQGVMK